MATDLLGAWVPPPMWWAALPAAADACCSAQLRCVTFGQRKRLMADGWDVMPGGAGDNGDEGGGAGASAAGGAGDTGTGRRGGGAAASASDSRASLDGPDRTAAYDAEAALTAAVSVRNRTGAFNYDRATCEALLTTSECGHVVLVPREAMAVATALPRMAAERGPQQLGVLSPVLQRLSYLLCSAVCVYAFWERLSPPMCHCNVHRSRPATTLRSAPAPPRLPTLHSQQRHRQRRDEPRVLVVLQFGRHLRLRVGLHRGFLGCRAPRHAAQAACGQAAPDAPGGGAQKGPGPHQHHDRARLSASLGPGRVHRRLHRPRDYRKAPARQKPHPQAPLHARRGRGTER